MYIACIFFRFVTADFPICQPSLALSELRTFHVRLPYHYTDVVSSLNACESDKKNVAAILGYAVLTGAENSQLEKQHFDWD
jgi:hypothetical protein